MTVFAIKAPGDADDDNTKFLADELLNKGIAHFFWSYHDTADLRVIQKKSWNDCNEDELLTWRYGHFLVDELSIGDWLVYINVPYYGQCIAAQVNGDYYFEKDGGCLKTDDGRHCIKIDKSSVIQFDRNDKLVHPLLSSKLKLQGAWYHIYDESEFFKSINNLKAKINNNSTQYSINYLNEDLNKILENFSNTIHKNNPGKSLEYFVKEIFDNIPGVIKVKVNGSGYGTDYGADVIVYYNSGLLDLIEEKILVIQVKSYEGEHYDTNALEQIEDAIEKYNADAAMIISTAKLSDSFCKAADELKNKLKKNDTEKNDTKKNVIFEVYGAEKFANLALKYLILK